MTGIQHLAESESLIVTAKAPDFCTTRVDVLDPVSGAEWDRAGHLNHPEGTVFHTSAWARVLASTYGHRPNYLRAEGATMLLPLMEVRSWLTGRRGVSLPFSDECGPLVSNGFEPKHLVEPLSKMAHARGWKHFEIRGGPELKSPTVAESSYVTHALELQRTEHEIFESFHSAVRRAIRKSERSGVTVRFAYDLSAMESFYQLHTQTRKKHGLPPQPFSFFRNIQREIIGPRQGFVVVAEKENAPIAAAVYFHTNGNAVYKYGASDESRQEFRGVNLAMWHAIRFLRGLGCRVLNFGRTSVANAGLRHFKLSWGATECPREYYRQHTKSGVWQAASEMSSGKHQIIFRHLPLWINRVLGRLLYPHLD